MSQQVCEQPAQPNPINNSLTLMLINQKENEDAPPGENPDNIDQAMTEDKKTPS